MAMRVSKVNANQLAYSARVRAVYEVSGQAIAEKAEERLYKKKRKRLDLVAVTGEMHQLLIDAEADVEKAVDAHADELADDDPIRDERDEAKLELGASFISAKSMIQGVFGKAFAKRVGLDQALEDRPDLLAKLTGGAVRLLRKAKMPKQSRRGATVDLVEVADSLDTRVERLTGLLSALKREEREAQQTMIARDQALAHWRLVIGLAAGWLESLARIAGEYEIADRVRPTERRQAGIPDEAEAEADSEEDAADTDATDSDAADTDASDTEGTDRDSSV